MKYDYELDFRSENNSHVQLLGRVPEGADVLELGCATGYMSAFLKERKGCRVVGVDIEADALEKAAPHCVRTVCADVDRPEWRAELDGERFDVILCADIIEHLKDPEAFLHSLRDLLKEDGKLLASVPNGAHVSVRLELLQGQLVYEDTGLLDRTHLHLFTHQSLLAMVSRAGYRVQELSYTFHDIPDEVIATKLRQAGLEPTQEALVRFHAPDAVAYQFIVEARPRVAGEAQVQFPELTDKPLRDSTEAYRALHERLHEVQTLAGRQQAVIQDRERHVSVQEGRIMELTREAHGLQTERTRLIGEMERLNQEVRRVHEELRVTLEDRARLQRILSTRTWRAFRALTLPVRAAARLWPYAIHLARHPGVGPQWFAKALRLLRQGGLKGLRWHLTSPHGTPSSPAPVYQQWINRCEPAGEPSFEQAWQFVSELPEPPRISIVMPVYEPRLTWLQQAIDSVVNQSYPHWELCIADDASPSEEVRELLKSWQQRDARIRLVLREENGHISAATNSALALAQGEWVGFMDHDDLLAPNALYHVARFIQDNPEVRILYSDEDKTNERGVRYAHYFKPDFNPDLMLSHNLLCHFSAYRRELIEQVGGMREGFEGAQDYDLALRCIARVENGQIGHIPRILYHWRAIPESTASGADAKPYALDAAVRAVEEYLGGQGVTARVTPSDLIHGMLRVQYPLPEPAPRVSIIIPTRNAVELVRQCVESIREHTDYPDYEIVVVDNQSDDRASLAYFELLQASGIARLLRYDQPFNYAAINNFAVNETEGEFLCFLNNDIEVKESGWLAEMVSQAARPGIGAVGARLLYPDGRLQHGGVITGLGGVAGHAMKFLSGESKGYNGRAVLVQNYSAVTAACLVVRRTIFEQVGGFDAEHLGVAFNDVDLCLRIREQGYRNLWTPYAELVHHESATRGPEDTAEKQARFSREIAHMKSRWGASLLQDPAYNPNLTLDREDFSLSRHIREQTR